MIDLQKDPAFKERVIDLVHQACIYIDDKPSRQGQANNPHLKELAELINNRFGLNIVFKAPEPDFRYNACVIIPLNSLFNPSLYPILKTISEFFKLDPEDTLLIEEIKQYSEKRIEFDAIDLKKAKIINPKWPWAAEISICFMDLWNGERDTLTLTSKDRHKKLDMALGVVSSAEIASAILHEVGHVFEYCEAYFNVTAVSRILLDHLKPNLFNEPGLKKKLYEAIKEEDLPNMTSDELNRFINTNGVNAATDLSVYLARTLGVACNSADLYYTTTKNDLEDYPNLFVARLGFEKEIASFFAGFNQVLAPKFNIENFAQLHSVAAIIASILTTGTSDAGHDKSSFRRSFTVATALINEIVHRSRGEDPDPHRSPYETVMLIRRELIVRIKDLLNRKVLDKKAGKIWLDYISDIDAYIAGSKDYFKRDYPFLMNLLFKRLRMEASSYEQRALLETLATNELYRKSFELYLSGEQVG